MNSEKENKYLWNIPENECHFLRLSTNRISLTNFLQWKIWWQLFMTERRQCMVSRIDNKRILECTVYNSRECLITGQHLKVKGIPLSPTPARLSSCKFIDEDNRVWANTEGFTDISPHIDGTIQSINLFELELHDRQQYIIRENTYRGCIGNLSPYPWITIADISGQDLMGASYCYAPGLVDDYVYVPQYHRSMDLLLGILLYYTCESELYRKLF